MDRLTRFFGLVKNEYIKILRKISTKIMIVLIILGAFALSGLMLIVSKTTNNSNDYMYSQEQINDSISWLDTTQPDNYQARKNAYQFLLDNGVQSDDWRMEQVFSLDDDSLTTDYINSAMNIIKTNDDKAFIQFQLDNATLSGDKWSDTYRLENNIGLTTEFDEQNTIVENVKYSKNQLDMIDTSSQSISSEKTKLENAITLGIYQLDNAVYKNTANMGVNSMGGSEMGFWDVFTMSPELVSLVGLLIIVIAGASVATEFHQGTIKFLLINPVKRWKILLSKYFTCITIGYIFIIILYVVCIPAIGLLHGFDGLNIPYLYVEDGYVHQMSSFLYVAKQFLFNSIDVVVMASLAFAISSLIRSSALAIGVSVFFMFAGTTITALLSQLGQDWGRYLIFANTDISGIINGNSLFPQHTVGFALIVIVAHMAVFLLTAWDGFTKRNV